MLYPNFQFKFSQVISIFFKNLTTVLSINFAYMIRKKKVYYDIMLIIQLKKKPPNLILTGHLRSRHPN